MRDESSKRRAFAARGRHQLFWFIGLLIFVIVVSVHDAGLLVLNQELIVEYERNPIGAWLIAHNAGSVWLFVYLKLIGTGLVSAILAGLYEQVQSTACAIVGVLALVQGALLIYLYAA